MRDDDDIGVEGVSRFGGRFSSPIGWDGSITTVPFGRSSRAGGGVTDCVVVMVTGSGRTVVSGLISSLGRMTGADSLGTLSSSSGFRLGLLPFSQIQGKLRFSGWGRCGGLC